MGRRLTVSRDHGIAGRGYDLRSDIIDRSPYQAAATRLWHLGVCVCVCACVRACVRVCWIEVG